MKKIVEIGKGFFGKIRDFFGKMHDRFGTKKMVIMGIAIVLIIALLFLFFGRGGEEVAATQVSAVAQYGDIIETVEQSGTVEPYERREITALVKGEVIGSPFNEGDEVEEGDTLYQIDDEDAQLNLEKTQNSITRSQLSLNETYKNINKLSIYAPASGTLQGFNLSVGDNVNGGEIGKIINNDNLVAKIPFTESDYNKISIGDSVTVTSASYMMTLSGTVTYKYDSSAGTGTDGSYLKNVEVSISNPGALSTGVTVAGQVNTLSGTVYSAKSGSIESGGETSLRAEVSGTVKSIAAKSGDKVKKGQLIAVLESESLQNSKTTGELSLRDSQLSLKSSQKSLDDYNITSPISGTVITKNVEVGDKIDNSNASTILMVVADMSKMKFTISVDELDIGDITLGQSVNIDADALPGQRFMGTVSNIAAEGTVSGQGVTTYEVEIVIDDPGELMPGMNVNANIVISEVRNVLTIPEEALNMARDGKATVYITEGEIKEGAVFPDDYEAREIEYGMSNGSVVEVKSGLSEGEMVVYNQLAGSDDDFMQMMQGMGGAMQGGGMQGGGMPNGGGGGMPSGGGGGMQGGRPGGM